MNILLIISGFVVALGSWVSAMMLDIKYRYALPPLYYFLGFIGGAISVILIVAGYVL